ncbi:hypothetical protein RHMOL_Rhmol08G0322500 [Rhododendron molle]|uniref:Uncharacterized protein n=1 Tax=Rhododendron molle TaxID=49168 RepID=A0ACC0MUT0_RHOML|nr:hypothetical protein RHMOL_Rhmol08G0322500 [Rhododendron molle]
MEKGEELTNWFNGVPIKWRLFYKDTPEKDVANPDPLGYGYGAGFDEYMNLVLEDAEEVNVKKKSRKALGANEDGFSSVHGVAAWTKRVIKIVNIPSDDYVP